MHFEMHQVVKGANEETRNTNCLPVLAMSPHFTLSF